MRGSVSDSCRSLRWRWRTCVACVRLHSPGSTSRTVVDNALNLRDGGNLSYGTTGRQGHRCDLLLGCWLHRDRMLSNTAGPLCWWLILRTAISIALRQHPRRLLPPSGCSPSSPTRPMRPPTARWVSAPPSAACGQPSPPWHAAPAQTTHPYRSPVEDDITVNRPGPAGLDLSLEALRPLKRGPMPVMVTVEVTTVTASQAADLHQEQARAVKEVLAWVADHGTTQP